ncbi:MAG: hypothetical protein ACE5EM_06470 [Sphingomonadales bacterium]
MTFASLIKRKKFKYEVMLCTDGRWIIEGILDDETEATTFARKVLVRKKGDEVKIIRCRKTKKGQTFTSEIFHEKRARPKEPPITLGEVSADHPVCQIAGDVFTLDSVLTISRLLRPFLIRNSITATELLHGWVYIRRLIDAGSLFGSATHRMASVQAAAENITPKERLAVLEKIVRDVVARARDLVAERKRVPRPDDGALDFISQRIQARFEPTEHAYVLMTVLTQKFQGASSISHKLDQLLQFLECDLEPWQRAPLESMAAECLDYAEVIQELFGPQPHLASFLCRLADVVNDKPADEKGISNASLVLIRRLIANGGAPQCRKVLIDRLVRELTSGKPLDRRSPEKEKHWLAIVLRDFKRSDGTVLGGAKVEQAISVRKKRLRQQELRRLGLIEAADAL